MRTTFVVRLTPRHKDIVFTPTSPTVIKLTVPLIYIAALLLSATALTACSADSDITNTPKNHAGASILPEPKFDAGDEFTPVDSIDRLYSMLPDPTVDADSRLSRADSLAIVYTGTAPDTDLDELPPRRFYSPEGALAHMAQSADSAAYFSGILPRMVEDNFEYADRLINSPYPYFLVLDKKSMRALLFDRHGHQVHTYPISASRNYGNKHRRSDRRTPEGFFFARGVYDSSRWGAPGERPDTTAVGVYGSRFIEIVGTIGIHGTTPTYQGSLGHRESAGCIRMRDADIIELADYIATGMPVIINPSDRDMAVNRSEGNYVQQIALGFAPADQSRDISAAVSGRYLARPERPDSVHQLRSDSIEHFNKQLIDSIAPATTPALPDSTAARTAPEPSATIQTKTR